MYIYRYRTGPGVVPDKVPKDVKNLVLVLNGREESKIAFAEQWLDYLPSLAMLQHVAVMLLGNEQCDNDWIKPYLSVNGGRVEFVFIIYDSLDVDDYNFYQWPLGVATYVLCINFVCMSSRIFFIEMNLHHAHNIQQKNEEKAIL